MFNPRVLHSYFRVYQKYIGRRLIIVFALTILAVLVESIGITLVIPLLATIDADMMPTGGTNAIVGLAHTLIRTIGLEGSTIGIIAFIGLMVGVKGIIRFAADGYGSTLTAELQREITLKMLRAYARMDYRFYAEHNTGHFVNIINNQIARQINSFRSFKNFAASLLTTFGYLAIAMLVDWRFALTAVVFGGAILLLFRRLNEYVKVLSRKTVNEMRIMNKLIVQCIQGFKYITSTGTMEPFVQNTSQAINRLTRYSRNQGVSGALTGAIREPISIMAVLVVFIIQVYVFSASIAAILVSIILLYRAMGQILAIQSYWQQLMNQIGSLEIVEAEFAAAEEAEERSGTEKLAPFNQGIELQNVRFRYRPEGEDIIRGVDLCIPARTTVAIVGPSGAGKSTFVDLLTLLLKPSQGHIRIDGIDSSLIDLTSWRRQIGYVSQETVVFDDSAAQNIGLWKGKYGRDPAFTNDIIAAAEKAFAREFIEQLPNGFETVVGDRGIRLSGGQRQRLFIARELFKNPRLLILDEATSALDSESEKRIQDCIDQLRGEMSIIIIAHRLSTIRNADLICVLDRGAIVEQGTFDELTRADAIFSRMVRAQLL